jgi:Mrp family chromosome partitioning ATPase
MSNKSVVRFDQALERAVDIIKRSGLMGIRMALVRDLYGCIRLAVDDRTPLPQEAQAPLAQTLQEFSKELGTFGPGEPPSLLLSSHLLDPSAVFDSPDALSLQVGALRLVLLERQVTGSDWLRQPASTEVMPRARRVTMFGIKGGVGRSTATSIWVQRLARKGLRVLVIDLDLESPGIGSFLLSEQAQPDFGVVDWLVEDAVGQAGEDFCKELAARSPLSEGTEGEILVVPAGGRRRQGYDYLAKLSRAYVSVAADDKLLSFGDRIERFIQQMEALLQPDVVILDSRAGLHDIAAAAITRLGALCLLFAVNSRQTWADYELLLQQWKAYPDRAARLRDNLQMVAALVPEVGAEAYLKRFTLSSYRLFQDSLYAEAAANDTDVFNFDVHDEEAPHQPLRIRWSRAFLEYDPLNTAEKPDEAQIEAAFGHFLAGADRLVFGERA